MNLTIDGVSVTLDTVGDYTDEISPLIQGMDSLAARGFAGLGKEGMTKGITNVIVTTDLDRFKELTGNNPSATNDGMTSNRGNTAIIWVNGDRPSNLAGALLHEL